MQILLHPTLATFFLIILLNSSNLVHTTTNSTWLTKYKTPRFSGCRRRPWVCWEDFPSIGRRSCCRNRCVDVTSDVNNCGFCGRRCRFMRQCCGGRCVNVNVNPFHCGECGHMCPFPSLCFYGMCGYADQPWPPCWPPRRCGGRRCPAPPAVVV